MTGGGFGGSAIALVARDRLHAVRDRVAADFVEAGHRDPAFLVAEPSGPAGPA
jgi:galactokinase